MEEKDKKIKVGLYIGVGPKPDNVETDMYVDMTGKNIGVYISGVGQTTDRIPGLIKKAIKDNPTLSQELTDILDEYKKVKSNEEQKGVFGKILEFGRHNEDKLIGAGILLLKIAQEWLKNKN